MISAIALFGIEVPKPVEAALVIQANLKLNLS
jgi:hypothetical protein